MPNVIVQQLHPSKPEFAALEAKIIAQRNEYASLDIPEYQHIYLGFIEGDVNELLAVIAAETRAARVIIPSATFTLEYHQSCVTHTEYPFLVYSFTLTQIARTEETQIRKFTILSWKLPRKNEYPEENAAIEQFMKTEGIQPYDDSSGVVCRIEPHTPYTMDSRESSVPHTNPS